MMKGQTMEVHPEIAKAEKEIQAILLRLRNDHGLAIANVDVDTRNFANYRTEIFEVAPRAAR
jgi:hypothetical protein